MQLVSSNRARRYHSFFLACVVTGLAGCGGGGGASPASVPPDITAPALPGGLSGAAAALIDDLGVTGQPWIGMTEADSGDFSLTGESPDTNDVVDKLPDPTITSTTIIPTTFSRFAYFRSGLSSVRDPGRYMLWGGLAENSLPHP